MHSALGNNNTGTKLSRSALGNNTGTKLSRMWLNGEGRPSGGGWLTGWNSMRQYSTFYIFASDFFQMSKVGLKYRSACSTFSNCVRKPHLFPCVPSRTKNVNHK